MSELSDTITRKFTGVYPVNEWDVLTDTGYEPLLDIKKTVPYCVWQITTLDYRLSCADDHIVFDEHYNQRFVKDLFVGDVIQTESGPQKVFAIVKTESKVEMFDVAVASDNHRYYTNGILSHNTTSAAGYLLWYAMFVPDSTILIAAHIGKGAMEIMDRIRYCYELCPDHIRAGVTTYNKGSIDFDNGSRIKSTTTTETTGRGMSISLLYLDEFAFVRPTIAREFWTAISPTLATGGKCIITSTPNSDEDQFSLLWKGANKCEDEFGNPTKLGINGFKAFQSSWWENPNYDEAWATKMRAQLGDEKFAREILCKFIIAEETLIDSQRLMVMEAIEPVFRHGQVRWFKNPSQGSIYAIGLDPAVGTGGDFAAIQVFDAITCEQIAEWKHNKTTVPDQIKIMAEIVRYIHSVTGKAEDIYYSVENNTVGEASLIAISHYGEENIPGYFLSEQGKKRKGFNTTHKSKMSACSKLKNLVEQGRMTINSRPLISELKTFIASSTSYAAKLGEHDDLVSALLIVVRMMMALQVYHKEVDKSMRDFQEEIETPLPFIVTTSGFSYF